MKPSLRLLALAFGWTLPGHGGGLIARLGGRAAPD